jgi:hypothetical protein
MWTHVEGVILPWAVVRGLELSDVLTLGSAAQGRHRDSLQRIDNPVDEFDNREITKDEEVIGGPNKRRHNFVIHLPSFGLEQPPTTATTRFHILVSVTNFHISSCRKNMTCFHGRIFRKRCKGVSK